ncbi:hypothetical protein MAQ5080_03116 [Marinomonas aquimarina]|uniref:DUF1415 domain-containing protein n=1 Tax=Marinomonas aquimarina TaxID=295068 RepID=A0A1A8TMJ2_9GAMM|nr:DUF1415 domain-containing protein [Marinomonas aquimarina]SBS35238.1 hypothetical protein MAQ5080_03116 [Marinomonas aquimarina]
MHLTEELVVAQTQKWVSSFIVAMNVCPFAKREVDRGSVRYVVVRSRQETVALEELMAEIDFLDQHPEVETTLVIFPTMFHDFVGYLDFVDDSEALMYEQGCEGVYQLATFHPKYCFSGTEEDDVSNYTNRSPYPMLHILREASLEKAIDYYGDTADIPERNIKLMEDTGHEALAKLMQQCMAQS